MRFPTKVAVVALALAALWLFPAGSARAQQPCIGRLPVELVSLNLRDANVQTTLRLLAQHYRVNMIVTDEVAGAVTLDFFRVPVRDVFQAIIESANLQCVEQGQVLRVSTLERVQKEEAARAQASVAAKTREAELRTKEAESQIKLRELDAKDREAGDIARRGPVKEEMIRLSYADADDVARTVQGILGLPPEGMTPPPLPNIYTPAPPTLIGPETPPAVPGAGQPPVVPQALPSEALAKGLTVKAHKPTNSVFIRYYENDLERIKKLIKEQLDVPRPQIHIAAQMVITTQNALEQLGIQWGGAAIQQPIGGHSPALIGRGFSPGDTLTGGTGVVGTYTGNSTFTGSGMLPISPVTGLPLGGNLVNLPTFALPTTAVPALGAFFGLVGRDYNINLAIQALETLGKAKSLAEPKIVTVENTKAVISRGFEVPYVTSSGLGGTQVQFKEALLQLQITPNVIKEDSQTKIRMKVLIENNEPDFTRAILGNPPIFRRRAENEVVVGEGQRLVIGGVLNETFNNTVRQVPLLGRIPVLGWLFKSREISSDQQDLIVIITPSVVAQTGAAKR